MKSYKKYLKRFKALRGNFVKSLFFYLPFSLFTMISGFGVNYSQSENLAYTITRYNSKQDLSNMIAIYSTYENNTSKEQQNFISVNSEITRLNSTVEQRGSFKLIDAISVYDFETPSMTFFDENEISNEVNLIPIDTFSIVTKDGISKYDALDFYPMFEEKNAYYDPLEFNGVCNITIDYANQILDKNYFHLANNSPDAQLKYDINVYKTVLIGKGLDINVGNQIFKWKISNIITSRGLLYTYSSSVFNDFITILSGQLSLANHVLNFVFFTSNSLFLNLKRIDIIKELFKENEVNFAYVKSDSFQNIDDLDLLNYGYNIPINTLSIILIGVNVFLFFGFYLVFFIKKTTNLRLLISAHILSNIILYILCFMLNVLFGFTFIFATVSLLIITFQTLGLCISVLLIHKEKENVSKTIIE